MHHVAIVILTKNEEANLPACLDTIEGSGAEVFVVDSGSTDKTLQIAEARGAHVLSHLWRNYASQFNWALDSIQTDAQWIMRLDADERITPELHRFIHNELPQTPATINGFFVRRRTMFLGKWIRHGGMFPVWFLQIWRRGCASVVRLK